MTIRTLTNYFANPLLLVLTAAIPVSVQAEPGLEYSYSDEWAVVSAPPPSGPYRPVHIDPRVPGQGITPPVTAAFDPDIQQEKAAAAAEQAAAPVKDIDNKVTAEVAPQQAEEVAPASLPDTPLVMDTGTAETGVVVDVAVDEPQLPATDIVSPQAEDVAAETLATSPVVDEDSEVTVAETPVEEPLLPAVTAVEEVPPESTRPTQAQLPTSDQAAPATALPPAITSAGQSPAPARSGNMMPPVAGTDAQTLTPPPPTQGLYERMMSPAAGGTAPRAASPGDRQPLASGQYGHMLPPPAAGKADSRRASPPVMQPPVPGRYGRMMPPAPGFNYPGPAWQAGRPGMPGYMNMPPFGYYRGPANRQGGEVPPPAVYQGRSPNDGYPYPAP